MRNISSKFLVALLLTVGGLQPAKAFFGVGDVVTDPMLTAKTIASEAARAADAARQIQVEINQYQQMVRDGLALADPVFKPLGETIRGVQSIYMQGQSLMYQAQNMDSAFGGMYPSYYSRLGSMGQGRSMTQTMGERYRTWSDKGYENTRQAMTASGMQVNGLANEHAMLERLVSQSNSAGGQMQALQAANQIAANQAEQMQSLRALVAQQNNLHANYMAHRIEQETFDNAFRQQFRTGTYTNTRGQGF